jgi:hypothetical protein
VLAADVGDDLVLWNPADRTSHVLNPTAGEVWRRLDGTRSVSDVVDELATRFSVEPSTVEHDTVGLIRELAESNLVDREVVAPPAPVWPEALPRPGGHERAHQHAVETHAWHSTTTSFKAFDFTFSLHDETSLTERALAPLLSPLATADQPDHRYTIRSHTPELVQLALDGRILRTAVPSSVARYLIWHVNRLAVASVPDRVVVHAGCVQRDGATVLLPASMDSGKSTLTASLVSRGWDYLSDEAVALDPISGDLLPYPRSITLDRGSWTVLPSLEPADPELASGELLGSWHVSPLTIRADSIGRPAPVDVVVFPRYDPDASTSLDPMRPVDALSSLLAHTFDFGGLGQLGLDRLRALADSPAYRLVVNDLDRADDLLCSLTSRPGG